MQNNVKDRKFCVYKHTVIENGKVYIGITSQNLVRRWQNGYGYKDNIYFYRAILKHKWENISHEILFENLSMEDAWQKEKELIKQYKSNNPKFGYNRSSGGDSGNAGVYGLSEEAKLKKYKKVICLETKEIFENIKIASEEKNVCRSSISACCKKKKISIGDYHWMYLDEYNEIGEQVRVRKQTPKSNRKKIVCIETQEVFGSFGEIGRLTGLSGSNICQCCNGNEKHTTVGGYTWKYFDEYDNKEIIKDCESIKSKSDNIYVATCCKKVKCEESGIIFDSMTQISKSFNINKSHIGECCHGKRKTAGGFHWSFVN